MKLDISEADSLKLRILSAWEENGILFIPTNWFYIQEIEEETVQYHIDIDSVFTFIPNFLRTR